MRITNPEDYNFAGYEISKNPAKKYNAILEHKKTKEIKKIPFGSRKHMHYHDKIGHYGYLDHNDKKRRENYHARHKNDKDYKFSSGYFSARMLW